MVTIAQIIGNFFSVLLLLILISGIISEQESREKNAFLTLVFLTILYIQCSTFWWVAGGTAARYRLYCVISRCLCAAVGYACFQGCSGLTSVTLPQTITLIAQYGEELPEYGGTDSRYFDGGAFAGLPAYRVAVPRG